jgi:hypothetical protein
MRRESREREHPLRFSSLESLGFFDSSSTWSDSPHATAEPGTELRRGRHEAPPPEPETVADWRPEEFGNRLTGSNIRWSFVITFVVVAAGLAGLAFWLYQRPAAQSQASLGAMTDQARALDSALPILEEFNEGLLQTEPATGSAGIYEVESAARALFTISGAVPDGATDLRAMSSGAAGSAIDGVRLAGEAHSYRAAVMPLLETPELETDPSLIELDDAARSFGTWQQTFDEVRTALPEGFMTEVAEQLDTLGGDLTTLMSRYVDALREDTETAAKTVLDDLSARLADVDATLTTALEQIQGQVSERITETRAALEHLLAG